VLTDAAGEAKIYQRKVSRDQNGSLLAKLEKDGMVVNEVTLAERKRLAVQLQPVVEKYSKIIGEEWLRELNGELAKVRAKQ
jgi:TRAP-type C4-dicarboxylate transport system substrate-binding protein